MKGRSSDKWALSAKTSSELANRLTTELGLIDKIIKSVVRALTEVFQGEFMKTLVGFTDRMHAQPRKVLQIFVLSGVFVNCSCPFLQYRQYPVDWHCRVALSGTVEHFLLGTTNKNRTRKCLRGNEGQRAAINLTHH